MLTGRMPYSGSMHNGVYQHGLYTQLQIITSVTVDKLLPPEAYMPEVTATLRDELLKLALAHDPAQRPNAVAMVGTIFIFCSPFTLLVMVKELSNIFFRWNCYARWLTTAGATARAYGKKMIYSKLRRQT